MLAIQWTAVVVAVALAVAVVTISGIALAAHYLAPVFTALLSAEKPAKVQNRRIRP